MRHVGWTLAIERRDLSCEVGGWRELVHIHQVHKLFLAVSESVVLGVTGPWTLPSAIQLLLPLKPFNLFHQIYWYSQSLFKGLLSDGSFLWLHLAPIARASTRLLIVLEFASVVFSSHLHSLVSDLATVEVFKARLIHCVVRVSLLILPELSFFIVVAGIGLRILELLSLLSELS